MFNNVRTGFHVKTKLSSNVFKHKCTSCQRDCHDVKYEFAFLDIFAHRLSVSSTNTESKIVVYIVRRQNRLLKYT